MDEAGVVAKFGVPPASIPDYLALVGDSADGYPGLPGWGAKSAAAVLAKFGHLESIPADPREWHVNVASAGRLAMTLAAERERAMLFRTLATLAHRHPVVRVGGRTGMEGRHAGVRTAGRAVRRGRADEALGVHVLPAMLRRLSDVSRADRRSGARLRRADHDCCTTLVRRLPMALLGRRSRWRERRWRTSRPVPRGARSGSPTRPRARWS